MAFVYRVWRANTDRHEGERKKERNERLPEEREDLPIMFVESQVSTTGTEFCSYSCAISEQWSRFWRRRHATCSEVSF